MKKFYITTPIYYVNDRVHIGHSYTTLAADVLARFHRLKGEKVFFLTGTDEHGGKIERAAKYLGKTPKQMCDENVLIFKNAWQALNISYDNFIRTTDLNHIKAVQNALDFLYKKKFIYKGVYKGLYCLGCEQYKTKGDLIGGKCPDHKIKPELIEEKSYLFSLSKFKHVLEKKIKKDELLIEPDEKKNEASSFLKGGLQDISISREKVKWGIPLPFDKNFTVYVWMEAFLNYLTGLGWQGKAGKVPEFFPPDIQLMSKDILRVHSTIWPALLLALDLPLPKLLFAHGYFTIEGQKMSKSLGNVIGPEELVKKFGVEGARYLLMSSLSYGQDGDISWERLTEKYNADLANGLGNLVSRVIKLNQDFKVSPKKSLEKIGKLDVFFDEMKFKEVLDKIWEGISWGNKYIEEKKLWELTKNNPGEARKALEKLVSLLAEISFAIAPFLPETSEKISAQLSTDKSQSLFPRV